MTQKPDHTLGLTPDLDGPRLIERAFPLEATSLDSVHEKNVRHGHISTLHIWPARRPLAASRAALIATLLPDAKDDAERDDWLTRLGGKVVKGTKKQALPTGGSVTLEIRETVGGILHWGRENGDDLQYFRDKIRAAYGGRAPRVLDPFAGGGAIPLEAMRLGCDVTASDLNPVAWFLLKCTLEYPRKLAGQSLPLPEFIRADKAFMARFLESRGYKNTFLKTQLSYLGLGDDGETPFIGMESDADPLLGDLAWHVRAWGAWVLARAKADLGRFYPEVGGKPTVAYLWARTVPCKSCRRTIPLLKTRWLCKKPKKRVLLTLEANLKTNRVEFDILSDVPDPKGNPAVKREHDKKLGAGTMSRGGVTCPFCGTLMAQEDIRAEAMAGKLGAQMTAVVVDEPKVKKPGRVVIGKSYRQPTPEEIALADEAGGEVARVFADIPFGLPDEKLPGRGSRTTGGSSFTTPIYGLDQWYKLFSPRQLLTLGTFVTHIRTLPSELMAGGYPDIWIEAVRAYLSCAFDRMLDFNSTGLSWIPSVEAIGHTFVRYALPIAWDYSEAAIINAVRGGWWMSLDAVLESYDTIAKAAGAESNLLAPTVLRRSVLSVTDENKFDLIMTDPPYYDAIQYSDLMDFFYVWMRRNLFGIGQEIDSVFSSQLSPKWDHNTNDGELIDEAARFHGDATASRENYETGMARAFQACHKALTPDGRLVIVFAHKQPDAWETLVTAIIKAGFIVTASWPIRTEQSARMSAQQKAALSSSVWLVCKKRDELARPGWDNKVLDAMRENIAARLPEYWRADIKGPDFVWAATGPALEAYSKHPLVKKANEPGQTLGVTEFLRHARRIVLDYAVSAVLKSEAGVAGEIDDLTMYYLLHRHDFGLADAPAGACILYAVGCNLSERLLLEQDVLERTGGKIKASLDDEAEDGIPGDDAPDETAGTGSLMRLKPWNKRLRAGLGYDPLLDATRRHDGANASLFDAGEEGTERAAPPRSRGVPMIDQAHRLMHLWKSPAGESAVNEYVALRGLRRNPVFLKVLQALIELSDTGGEERALLERLSNHLGSKTLQEGLGV